MRRRLFIDWMRGIAVLRGFVPRPVLTFAALALGTALATPIVWSLPLAHAPHLVADYLRGGPPQALFPLFPLACVLASMVALAHLIDPMRQLLARQRKVQLA